jgi:hypothetical protein
MRCTKRLSISDVARALHFIGSGGAGALLYPKGSSRARSAMGPPGTRTGSCTMVLLGCGILNLVVQLYIYSVLGGMTLLLLSVLLPSDVLPRYRCYTLDAAVHKVADRVTPRPIFSDAP